MFPRAPIEAGDFVATIGFSSADYLTIDLVCGYLGLVAVPLQHNTSASRLVPILERENATLKRLRADAELEKACPLKEIAFVTSSGCWGSANGSPAA